MIATVASREKLLVSPIPPVANESEKSVTEQVVEYIERNYATQISLRDVALAIGYSACHLTTTFRQATGTPITACIIKRRIIAAQKLLGEGNVDVATACEAVGFSDLCYFTRQFVRHVGVTPGRFRSLSNAPSITIARLRGGANAPSSARVGRTLRIQADPR